MGNGDSKAQGSSLWEKIKKGLKDSFYHALEKSEEITSLGRLKLDILQLHEKIEAQFAELGGYLYHQQQLGRIKLNSDEHIQKILEKIQQLETELKEKEAELERIRDEEGLDID